MVLKPLIGGVPREALVVYEGVTDAIGNVGGTTLKCSAIGSASSYPDFDGNQIILTSGSYKGPARDINGATNGDAAGTITVANAFGGQIASGTSFIITGIRTVPAEVATLTGYVGYEGATSLADKLTAARAGYLDEINAAALAQGAGDVSNNAQLASLVRAIADIVRAGGSGDAAAIKAETESHPTLAEIEASTVLAMKSHLVNGTGNITPPTDKGIWDYLPKLDAPVSGIPTTPTLQATWTDEKATFLDEKISAPKTLTAAERDNIRKSVCLVDDTENSIGKILYELYVNRLTAARAGYLDELAPANIPADLDAIKAKSDLILSDSGTGTLNDANVSDTIVPASLPTKAHIAFDISNLNNANDDFTIEVKVGAAASERVVAYYKLTSDGTDITCDTGSGTGNVIKQRRFDISDILVYTGEQVIVSRTKNSATDRNVDYKYLCGV